MCRCTSCSMTVCPACSRSAIRSKAESLAARQMVAARRWLATCSGVSTARASCAASALLRISAPVLWVTTSRMPASTRLMKGMALPGLYSIKILGLRPGAPPIRRGRASAISCQLTYLICSPARSGLMLRNMLPSMAWISQRGLPCAGIHRNQRRLPPSCKPATEMAIGLRSRKLYNSQPSTRCSCR